MVGFLDLLSDEVGGLRDFSTRLIDDARLSGSLGADDLLAPMTVRTSYSAGTGISDDWLISHIEAPSGRFRGIGMGTGGGGMAVQTGPLVRTGTEAASRLLRIDRFAQTSDLGGLPILENSLGPLILDVFNPVIQAELADRSGIALPDDGIFDTDTDLAAWLHRIDATGILHIGGNDDLLAEAMQWEIAAPLATLLRRGGGPSAGAVPPGLVRVVVTSKASGLQVLSAGVSYTGSGPSLLSPQHFGNTLSSPVTGYLQAYRYYYFYGVASTAQPPQRDPTPFHCTPFRTATATSF
ncbi:hypothetical protein [Tropicimonas sp. IMCC34043]|uniref:hypothetical protein n=1 Tax=Tropicimonas sp. IMCC34043 TaxID=2248760 RepID=UPI001300AD5B|nr:hypothetical protein [Tropicimonas sp. IMCC34043]